MFFVPVPTHLWKSNPQFIVQYTTLCTFRPDTNPAEFLTKFDIGIVIPQLPKWVLADITHSNIHLTWINISIWVYPHRIPGIETVMDVRMPIIIKPIM